MSNPIPSPSLPTGKGAKKAVRWKIGQVPPPAPAHSPILHINIGCEEKTIMVEFAHATLILELREATEKRPADVALYWQWIHTDTEVVFRRDYGKAAIPVEAKTLTICTSTKQSMWGSEVWLEKVAGAKAHPKYWLNKEKAKREALVKAEAHVLPIAV